MCYIISADIGGTKLAAALFNAEGKMVRRSERASESADGEKLFLSFIEVCDELCLQEGIGRNDVMGISAGLPGIVDVEKGIAIYQNNLPWKNFPFSERVGRAFPLATVHMDNDVYMAAWGEYTARRFSDESFVYITLSTGISCCSIFGGSFVRGTGMAGEIGFSLTDEEGTTLEEKVSGPSLERKGRAALQNEQLTLKEIMELYYAGDERTRPIVHEAVTALAKEIHHLIAYVDPACIVLGGGVFNHHPKLVELVRQEVGKLFSHPLFNKKESRIESSRLKGDAGLHGAFMKSKSMNQTKGLSS